MHIYESSRHDNLQNTYVQDTPSSIRFPLQEIPIQGDNQNKWY